MQYIGHNYIRHTYIGHTYIGHNYMGHTYIGHNYVGVGIVGCGHASPCDSEGTAANQRPDAQHAVLHAMPRHTAYPRILLRVEAPLSRRRRRHVHCAGMGAPVLKKIIF